VTRGLDPAAPRKPSGVEWLGEVPAHWEERRNKYIFREVNNRSATGLETRLSMSQRLGLVESDRVDDKTLQAETAEGFKICQKGDLVLNKLKSHLGVFAQATIPGLVSPDYTVLRLITAANVRYFELLYKHPAYIGAFTKAATGIVVGFLRLYTSEFYNIRSPFPPLSEQNQIMQFIDTEAEKVNLAIAQAEREIELMQEYRTTLISDVVTGKVDVREHAAEPATGELL
jgi:type I restriction enzyme S subunit